MTGIEAIRGMVYSTIALKNTYKRLESIAIGKANWKLMDEYKNWAFVCDFQARAYNNCLVILGENEEETDEIAADVFKREMIRLYKQEK